jgi:hypothetical protein
MMFSNFGRAGFKRNVFYDGIAGPFSRGLERAFSLNSPRIAAVYDRFATATHSDTARKAAEESRESSGPGKGSHGCTHDSDKETI